MGRGKPTADMSLDFREIYFSLASEAQITHLHAPARAQKIHPDAPRPVRRQGAYAPWKRPELTRRDDRRVWGWFHFAGSIEVVFVRAAGRMWMKTRPLFGREVDRHNRRSRKPLTIGLRRDVHHPHPLPTFRREREAFRLACSLKWRRVIVPLTPQTAIFSPPPPFPAWPRPPRTRHTARSFPTTTGPLRFCRHESTTRGRDRPRSRRIG